MEGAKPGQLPEGRRTRAEALKQGGAGIARQSVTSQEDQPKVLLLGPCLASTSSRIPDTLQGDGGCYAIRVGG